MYFWTQWITIIYEMKFVRRKSKNARISEKFIEGGIKLGFDHLLEGLFRHQGGHHGGHHDSHHEREDRYNHYSNESLNVGEEGYNTLAEYCPNCGSPGKPEALFCIQCGTAMGRERERRCVKCQSAVPIGAKFCSNCGIQQE